MQPGTTILTHAIKIVREAAASLQLIKIDPGFDEPLAVGRVKSVEWRVKSGLF